MVRFIFAALCVSAVIVVSSAMTPLEFGMDMSATAYNAICWYENLKIFPNTNSDGYNKCSGSANHVKKSILTKDFFKKYPEKKEEYFGKWFDQQAMGGIPATYKSKCGKYLSDAKAKPTADEGEALNDGGNDYPFKAFSYCLIHTLREKHGDKAVEDVKNERTVSLKHWMQTLLDRDNEFRKRHGVEPFKLVQDLNVAAQKWADKLASECQMYHSKNEDPGRQWRGAGTGESLAAGGGDDDDAVAAYIASNGWYEEIKDYPYPQGFQGNDDDLFHKIGHFTQSVWKGTKYVGYGYAYNKDCAPYKFYIAARYAPAGNMEGEYQNNVLPPKD